MQTVPTPSPGRRARGAFFTPAWRGAAALALAWASAGMAAAGDVYWSIGIQQPGVQVVVGQPRPAPVVLVPAHRVVVVPGPVYRASWVPPGHAGSVRYSYWHGRLDDHRGHWQDERRHRHGGHPDRDDRRDGHRDEGRDHWHGHRR